MVCYVSPIENGTQYDTAVSDCHIAALLAMVIGGGLRPT
jgi:hypothetical protein